MVNRNKIMPFIFLFFLINGSFVTMFSSVSASELVEDSWNTKTPMRYNRSQFGVVAVDGKIYAIGGYAGSSWSYSDINEKYDPKTDSWTTLKSMPTPRAGLAVAEYQGKIYCIGGYTIAYNSPMLSALLDVNEVYDVATDSWSTKASMPVKTTPLHAYVVNGQIFVITLDVLYIYDPVKDVWTNKTTIPPSENLMFSAMVGNKIIFGGRVIFGSVFEPPMAAQFKVMVYVPKANRWSEGSMSPEIADINRFAAMAEATTGRYAPVRVYVSALVKVYANDGSFVNLGMLVYDPLKDTWSTVKAPSIDISGCSVTAVDDTLYIIGGALNEQYVPIGYTSVPKDFNLLKFSQLVVVLVLLIGVIAVGLFFYFEKGKRAVVGGNRVDRGFFDVENVLVILFC
jgi:hypothetical protein